ncbi:glycoside hydrolase family 127 protein [Microbacterium sp. VKM Ac-2923]|uniref:glycoside hydrolase family 127 protein n=1 Tax=Microbacterium sp. VKM Ac-2923 TaxID=2929476 RepID=UPI001FB3DAE3|nr:beta-L-arabinofuranosidase domain-containing protein [Microbacterium sp. VKM Ac-2923]MCJ1709052.1 glycoside hydrolase family 127 protein [Microbacterium sp. VKM Ac-2923]
MSTTLPTRPLDHATARTVVAPVVPSRSRLRPLGLGDVRIVGGFWGERQAVNAAHTLSHILSRLESEGWLPNFDRAAAGTLPAGRRGREFSDSEVYKYLEAAAWELGRRDDIDLERTFRGVVDRVAAAQEADGYLNTEFGREGQQPRWSDLEWGHELYCLGHLFQAAVARERTRPGSDDGLLLVALRAADLVCEVFGPDGIPAFCGHPEIETALAELARVTGDARYAAQAALFVNRRGHETLADIEWGRRYFQDDVPVRDAEALSGHAVRANYLAAGAVDVAVESDDDDLLASLRAQWSRTRGRRTYITGGQGSHHQDEAFGDDWELPSDRAYSETCAGIASVMFSWRLLLAGGESAYADLIERTLFNVVATSPSADGRSFFYANTLHQRVPGVVPDPDATSPRASSSLRAPWFEVSCCPPNVARTLASLDAYVATADAGGIQIHQYAPAEIRTTLDDGREVSLDVATRYPDEGTVRVTVIHSTEGAWTLSLRVPEWADGARVRVGSADVVGEALPVSPGWAVVRREFRAGDVVELELPMAPRIVVPDPRIDAIRGCVAVERGPEVLALESVDLATAEDVGEVVLDVTAPPVEGDGRVWVSIADRAPASDGWPFGAGPLDADAEPTRVALVPYHDWGNRGPSTMRVWMPTT